MILSKEIKTTISHLNIDHYTSIGYDNIKCNQSIIVPIEHLPKESNLKILVKCDVCNQEKSIFYQKYNKNISKYGIYTCSTICAQFKIKKTNLEKYGNKNYVNTKLLNETVKAKYDIITNEIEERGYINCSICKKDNQLSNYIFKNGRYRKKCLKCRTKTSILNRKVRFDLNPELEKEKEKIQRTKYIERNREKINNRASLYYHNVLKYTKKHKYIWRSILRSYLKRICENKTSSTYNMLGYSDIELKNHIESLFTDQMSWNNHNILWQVDHIIPISFFKKGTPSEIVNSLKNLRPLDKYINLSRGSDIDNFDLLLEFKNYINESKLKGII